MSSPVSASRSAEPDVVVGVPTRLNTLALLPTGRVVGCRLDTARTAWGCRRR